MSDETTVRAKPDEVAAKVIDGEAVLINLATGVYYSMRGSGAYLWSQLEPGSSVACLSASLADRYGIDSERARQDVRRLVDELRAEGLVVSSDVLVAADGTPAPEIGAAPEPYEVPRLEKFDDMADMFALDPPLPELPSVGGR
ncbi:MAG: PqqD family protein [Geminicoccaceae bacterium]